MLINSLKLFMMMMMMMIIVFSCDHGLFYMYSPLSLPSGVIWTNESCLLHLSEQEMSSLMAPEISVQAGLEQTGEAVRVEAPDFYGNCNPIQLGHGVLVARPESPIDIAKLGISGTVFWGLVMTRVFIMWVESKITFMQAYCVIGSCSNSNFRRVSRMGDIACFSRVHWFIGSLGVRYGRMDRCWPAPDPCSCRMTMYCRTTLR